MWQGSRLVSENWAGQELEFFYDESGSPYAFSYKASATATPVMYYYVTNLQGDVVNILNASGSTVASYSYNAWGKVLTATGTMAAINPLRYRGYYYDTDTGLYYLQSRYYDPQICRFINADGLLSITDSIGTNLFAYCGNNPVMGTDSTGHAWWHWALGAAVVAGCAIATVVTCGGFAAAVAAVGLVGSGMAAATTASTVAAAAFIGSSLVYGGAALSAALDSDSVQEFNDRGSWGTVAATVAGAAIGGAVTYLETRNDGSPQTSASSKEISTIRNDIIDLPRTGSALKTDPHHAFPDIVDNYAGYAAKTQISNGTLYQIQGSLNGKLGRFEWIVQNQQVTHRMFVLGGGINGIPIMP